MTRRTWHRRPDESASWPPPSELRWKLGRRFIGRLSRGFGPFSACGPGRARRYGEYHPIPLRRCECDAAWEEEDGRLHSPPVRFCALRRTRDVVRRHTCATGTAGVAVARPSVLRHSATPRESCAAGSFLIGGVPLPARGPLLGLARRRIFRPAPDSAPGILPFAVLILPAGVGAFPPVFPTRRFAAACLDGFGRGVGRLVAFHPCRYGWCRIWLPGPS